MVGTQVGNYRIQEKLGEGGMGVVYKAVDVNLDRVVAIKALNTELRGNAELEQRFRAEAKAQANLNHTNLATLYALLIEDGRPWMVMEFIEGETFEQMAKRRGPIPSEEAIPLFRQALLGIGYAHRMGIVHRDIKPSNIMLNRQGIVKVMDFGIAKVLGARGMTRTGTQMGTAFYMSPEQVLNRGVDIRSDIYSLGVTLYEMLTANVPFSGDSDYQIMSDHVNTPPPLLTKFFPYVPPGVQNAVLKAIEKRQDVRFQTVEEFGMALEHPRDFEAAAAASAAPAAGVPRPGATVVETTRGYTAGYAAPGVYAPPAAAPMAGVPPSAQPAPAQMGPGLVAFLTREWKIVAGGLVAVFLLIGGWLALRPNPKPAALPVLPPTASISQNIQSPPGAMVPLNNPTPITPGQTGSGQAQGPQTQTNRGQTSQAQTQTQTGRNQAGQTQSSQTQTAQTGQTQASRTQTAQTNPDAAARSDAAMAGSFVIPVGTLVTVRMVDSVDSSRDRAGQRFQASVDEPVIAGGRTAIPRGATARVVLSNVAQAGHIEGRNTVQLELIALSIHGKSYPVRSTLFEKQGASRGKRSAEVIGGGAAVGAVVGGIFGHKKGAAEGAAAGAGAGTGAQYMTNAAPVTVPPETRIDFTLRTAVSVAP